MLKTAATDWRLIAEPLDLAVDAVTLFSGLFGEGKDRFWLDSARDGHALAQYSYMGMLSASRHSAKLTYRVGGEGVRVEAASGEPEFFAGDIFQYLRANVSPKSLRGDPAPFPFCGGYVGYLGYELGAEMNAQHSPQSPVADASLLFVDRFIALDLCEGKAWTAALVADDACANEARAWSSHIRSSAARLSPQHLPEPGKLQNDTLPIVFQPRHARAVYVRNVNAALDYIAGGETYQLCLTTQWKIDTNVKAFDAYRALRHINPAPFGAFFDFGNVQILSASPERFLSITAHGAMQARPIKGTIARGTTTEQDDVLRKTLSNSKKDNAENLMIVDLLRNDLAKCAVPGSIRVSQLATVETYQTLHQMVSVIEGQISPDAHPIDVIRAAFPGGSMTGAPKHHSMAILSDLEDGPRGPYAGAIGYISVDGAIDLNIVIRTIIITDGIASIGSGGAIIAASTAEDEYQEMLLKARPQMAALALAITGNADAYDFES